MFAFCNDTIDDTYDDTNTTPHISEQWSEKFVILENIFKGNYSNLEHSSIKYQLRSPRQYLGGKLTGFKN